MNFRSIIAASTTAVGILFCSANAQESYIVLDSVSGKVFFANQTETKRPVASLTKVATAKVALDWATVTKTSLGTKLVIPPTAATVDGSNPLKLQPGDSLSIRDALYASLLASDNVSAHSIANFIGFYLNQKRGANTPTIESFVREMNQLAKMLKMKNTTFVNPHGLDPAAKQGTSTATDMALLAMSAMRNDGLAFMVKQKMRKVTVTRANGKNESFTLRNTNTLLGKNGVVGLKTGTTAAAGQCLITVIDKKPLVFEVDGKKHLRPRQLVVVILGSNDRFNRTSKLITDGWAGYLAWGNAGFQVPADGLGLLKLPAPVAPKAPARPPVPVPTPTPTPLPVQ